MSEVEAPANAAAAAGKSQLHSGIEVGTFVSLQMLAAVFPLAAGFALFGWRAVGTTVCVVASALAAALLWRNIGWRGRQMRLWHCLWMAILVSLMLPGHLFSSKPIDGVVPWPILPAAGIMLAMVIWLLGGLGGHRIHPAVVTVLILFALFEQTLTPRYVLRMDRLFWGDLVKAAPPGSVAMQRGAWVVVSKQPARSAFDALTVVPAADKLLAYTSAQNRPDQASLTLQMLIRDDMPPLEDLVIAGQSSPIGNGSAIMIIVGGLFLLYRGLIDFRLPVLTLAAAVVAILVLPIPVVIADTGTQWRWLAFREHYLGWPTAITFMNYEILASPLLLTIFFLSNAPGLRPITRRGRAIFAVVLGMVSAVMQLYFFAPVGPYVALLLASLLTPMLDRTLRPRTLV